MALDNELVVDLLTYIEQVEKLKIKPAFSVPTEYFAAHQHELKGLPEIRFNVQAEGEDVWLCIPRLKEIPAPEPDEKLAPWITIHKTPAKTPELKPSIETPVSPENPDSQRARVEIHELFDWYVENQWTPWATAELPRRKTIHRYNQVFAIQQAIASDGADTPLELVWGIGLALWKKEGHASALKYPLITQGCEINLNRHTFDLEIRPRNVDARIELDCYAEMEVPGVTKVEAFWKSAIESTTNRVNPFEFSTFEPTLKTAVVILKRYAYGGGARPPSSDGSACSVRGSTVPISLCDSRHRIRSGVSAFRIRASLALAQNVCLTQARLETWLRLKRVDRY